MIKTFKDGNTITKVRVEKLDELYQFIFDEITKLMANIQETEPEEELVTLAKATPSKDDIFDEKTGNILAFRKARIKSNIKKFRIIENFYKMVLEIAADTNDKTYELLKFVNKDVNYIKKHFNPNFEVNY